MLFMLLEHYNGVTIIKKGLEGAIRKQIQNSKCFLIFLEPEVQRLAAAKEPTDSLPPDEAFQWSGHEENLR